MKRSEERILTSHVGSIIRPKALTELSNDELLDLVALRRQP